MLSIGIEGSRELIYTDTDRIIQPIAAIAYQHIIFPPAITNLGHYFGYLILYDLLALLTKNGETKICQRHGKVEFIIKRMPTRIGLVSAPEASSHNRDESTVGDR